MLRNAFNAGSSGCSCSWSCGLSSGWLEPQARGCEVHNKGLRDLWPRPGGEPGTQRHGRSRRPSDFPALSLWGEKSKEAPFFGVPPQRRQPQLVFCWLLHHDEVLLRVVWDSAKGSLGWSCCEWGGCGWEGALLSAQVLRAWQPGWLLDGRIGTFPWHTNL